MTNERDEFNVPLSPESGEGQHEAPPAHLYNMPAEIGQVYEDEEEMDVDSSIDIDEDESDVMESDFQQEELTPNDIFGLDPLDVLTLEELAEYLRVSPAAARRAVKEQNLPGKNIGGEWRFLRDAVANWLRGESAEAQKQKKSREEYSAPPQRSEQAYSPPPRRPYSAEETGGEYRPPRQRYSSGNRQQGGRYGNTGNQYGNTGNQYGSGSQYGGRQQGDESTGGQNRGGEYRQGEYRGGYQEGGGQGYSGPPRRKNKRQMFVNERGKRMDRRRHDEGNEQQQHD